jgi:hypothetical protein
MSLAMQPSRGRSALQEFIDETNEEKEAMKIIRAINPKHMFLKNKVLYEMMVLDPSAKPKKRKDGTIELPTAKPITGSQIHGVFLAFLDKTEYTIGHAWLTGYVTILTAAFVNWLLNSYTSRYKGLRNEEGMKWLADICRLVVIDWIMVEKYTRYMNGEKTFASDKVRQDMEWLMILREAETEEIKGNMHSFKHDETKEERDANNERRHNNLIARLEAVCRAKNEEGDVYE